MQPTDAFTDALAGALSPPSAPQGEAPAPAPAPPPATAAQPPTDAPPLPAPAPAPRAPRKRPAAAPPAAEAPAPAPSGAPAPAEAPAPVTPPPPSPPAAAAPVAPAAATLAAPSPRPSVAPPAAAAPLAPPPAPAPSIGDALLDAADLPGAIRLALDGRTAGAVRELLAARAKASEATRRRDAAEQTHETIKRAFLRAGGPADQVAGVDAAVAELRAAQVAEEAAQGEVTEAQARADAAAEAARELVLLEAARATLARSASGAVAGVINEVLAIYDRLVALEGHVRGLVQRQNGACERLLDVSRRLGVPMQEAERSLPGLFPLFEAGYHAVRPATFMQLRHEVCNALAARLAAAGEQPHSEAHLFARPLTP